MNKKVINLDFCKPERNETLESFKKKMDSLFKMIEENKIDISSFGLFLMSKDDIYSNYETRDKLLFLGGIEQIKINLIRDDILNNIGE